MRGPPGVGMRLVQTPSAVDVDREANAWSFTVSDDPFSKGAEAVSEASKATGKAIDLVRATGSFIKEIVLEPIKVEVGIHTDRRKFRQFQNKLAMWSEAERMMREKGVQLDNTKELPFGDISRIVDRSAEEDEPEMQVQWGRLLANALDPKSETDARRVYSDLLSQLSTTEIIFMEILRLQDDPEIDETALAEVRERWFAFKSDDQWMAVQNLMRLGCAAYSPTYVNTEKLFVKPSDMDKSPFPTIGQPALVEQFVMISTLTELQSNARVTAGLSTNIPHGKASGKTAEEDHRIAATAMCNNFRLTILGSSLIKACRE